MTGTIPSWFTALLTRQELLLNDNFLSGSIPDISSAAVTEFLSNPEGLVNARLKRVDLSNNMLEGSLPAWGGFLGSLQFIDLSNNQFTGTMTMGELLGTRLWAGLETFRVANNLLTGTMSPLLPEQIREVDLQGKPWALSPLSACLFAKIQSFVLSDFKAMLLLVRSLTRLQISLAFNSSLLITHTWREISAPF